MGKTHRLLLVAFVLIETTPLIASGPSFQPDTKIDGASLKAWHPYGQADWRTEKGEIVGVPRREPLAGSCSTMPTRTVPCTLNTCALAAASPACFSARKKHQMEVSREPMSSSATRNSRHMKSSSTLKVKFSSATSFAVAAAWYALPLRPPRMHGAQRRWTPQRQT